jgi:antitoxin component YwqK of YwqJK toxin-antitoxin module
MKKLLLLPILFLSLISTPCLSETMGELVKRDGIYYKKFSDTPFTGKTTEYYDSGQLKIKVNYKNGEREGDETSYYENGQL